MKKILAALGATALLAAAAEANASPFVANTPNWYWGISGGGAWRSDTDSTGIASGRQTYNTGAIGTVSVGYAPFISWKLLNPVRVEAELGYHYNEIDSSSLGGVATGNSGSRRSLSYMANAYYDLRNSTPWTPYVGAGLGAATDWLSRNSGLGNSDNSDTVFAYQFMAGLAYIPKATPNMEWTLGYRYYVEDHPEFGGPAGRVRLGNDGSHNVEIGLKWHF